MRRAARVAGKVAFAVLAVVFLAVGGLWTFAQSARGGDLIRRIALRQVNGSIAGQLSIERLRFGGNRLSLGGVVLRDPEGGVVARVADLDLRFRPLALLHRTLQIDRLEIDRPDLRVVSGPGGSNLSRALASRHPAATAPPQAPAEQATGPGFIVDLRELAVRGGNLTVRSGAPPAHVKSLNVDGSLRFETGSQRLRTDLRVEAVGARIEARGGLDLAARRAAEDGFTLRVHDVNLAELMRDAPQSDFALNLNAHGTHASADLRLRSPGLTAKGHASTDGVHVDARLGMDASDLDATARSLARCHLAPPVELAGAGTVDVAVSGALQHPKLAVAARVPRLVYQDDAVRDLKLSGVVPRLDKPQEVRLDVSAAGVRLAERRITGLEVALHIIGPHITVNARTATPYPLALTADGWRLTPHALRLDALTLRYPGEAWTLANPTKLVSDGDRLELTGLDLRGRGQRIRADLSKNGPSGRARLAISHFDPGRLPRPLVPPAVARLGRIDLDADVRFSPSRLRGRLAARALGTGVDADFDVPASWPPRNASQPLRITLATPQTDLGQLASTVQSLTGQPLPVAVRGRLGVNVQADGRAGDPRVAVTVHGRGLAVAGQPVGDVDVTVDGHGDRPIALRVQAAGAGDQTGTLGGFLGPPATTPLGKAQLRQRGVLAGPVQLTAQTTQSVRALLRRPPSAAALARLPFEAHLDVRRVSLAAAGKLARPPLQAQGNVALHADLHGTAQEPEGKLAVDVTGLKTARVPATNARIEATLERRATQVNVRVVQGQHALLALEAHAGAALRALIRQEPWEGSLDLPRRLRWAKPSSVNAQDRAAWADIPLRVRAVVGPLAMTHAGLPQPDEPDVRRSELRGQLHADLAIDGTLRAPRLLAHAQADDLRLDRAAVGYARVTLRYEQARAELNALVASANGGKLTVDGSVRANLGLPALMAHPLDPQALPFDLTVKAQQLDLRGFSGLTAMLPRAAGLLDLQIQARGTPRDPRFSGRVECTRCELQLDSMGDFRDIHLALHGDTDKIVLDELTAKSGAGHARVTATVARADAQTSYELTGTVDATDMPIYQEGQSLATINLNAGLSGSTRGGRARAKVDIRDARIRLSDEKRKNLQSLKAPDDIVLVQDGRPINRRQAKRLRAVDERLNRLRAGDEAAATPGKATAPPAPPSESDGVGPWSSLLVSVNAPRKLWVTGSDAYLELGLARNFRVRIGREVQVYGQVVTHRGRINAFGRRFDLKADSTLEFGGPPDQPILDVTAQYQNDAENVTVLLTAKGPLDHLAIGVSSPNRPDLSPSQLYTLIITGHLQFGGGGGGGSTSSAAASEAAGLIAGAIAGGLQKTLAKRLPLDVLTIDAGGGGLAGTQFEAGRYMTDRLYVGYVGRIGADPTRYQNKNAVHVEYQLTSRWQFAGEYGDVGTGSADLIWKKSY